MAKDLKKKLDIFLSEKFEELRLEEVIGDRFGRYSKYIIQERAIPDIRDGLKPVQRRILYGMNALKVTSNAPYKKSARIVGEVMGKYHPHGDSSIYDAMVRMSQSWKMGVTLIDMHGNNGSIDGDGPAAMRYTETRMSKNAEYLLQDIDKNTVPFIPNFDDEEIEPTVLPAKFPNLLVNGAMGISSGYATYIPTHNINEVVNATIERINNPDMTVDDLLKIMPGPDFPTGGIVQGIDGIREAFLTGSGSVVVRSKYEIEDMGNGQQRIVITEIPYDTFKSKTVEKMEQLRMDGKVPDVLEVRDESGRDGLRIAIDLKKGANAEAIINFYLKNTDLQINCNYNMVSICNRRPMRLGVLPILDAYIEHQKEVITNRTNFELNKALKRLHIVEGLIKMVDIVDLVIAIIRKSKNKADSIVNLVDEFKFTELQAEAIVMMRLYSLSNQDITALRDENNELQENIKEYNKILSSEKELLKVIKKELSEMNKVLVCPRRTKIEEQVSSLKIDETDLISKEQTIVSISREGYIKRTNLKSYNTSKANGLKENDSILYLNEVSTLDTLLIFTNLGNYIYLPVFKIPEVKFKDVGAYISTLVAMTSKEKFVAVFCLNNFIDSYTFLLTTKTGQMKQTLLSEYNVTRYTKPIKAMKLQAEDELVAVDMIKDPLEVILFTKNAEALRFRASDIALYGTNTGGVKSINLKPDDYVISAFYCNKNDDFLLLTNRNTIKRMRVTDLVLTKRSRAGSSVIKKIKSNPYLLMDAKKLTPNQYKENVLIDIAYQNGNDKVEASTLKYNVSDGGKQIISTNQELKNPLLLNVPAPSKMDDAVSPDYLIEVKTDLFSQDFGITDEKPLTSKKITNQGIFDELDAILAKETNKKNDSLNPSIDITENQKKEIKFKKISLFDDEE
ncbi:MAG: DNA topoisomerase IV subunit A [Anaeroplasma sp.]